MARDRTRKDLSRYNYRPGWEPPEDEGSDPLDLTRDLHPALRERNNAPIPHAPPPGFQHRRSQSVAMNSNAAPFVPSTLTHSLAHSAVSASSDAVSWGRVRLNSAAQSAKAPQVTAPPPMTISTNQPPPATAHQQVPAVPRVPPMQPLANWHQLLNPHHHFLQGFPVEGRGDPLFKVDIQVPSLPQVHVPLILHSRDDPASLARMMRLLFSQEPTFTEEWEREFTKQAEYQLAQCLKLHNVGNKSGEAPLNR